MSAAGLALSEGGDARRALADPPGGADGSLPGPYDPGRAEACVAGLAATATLPTPARALITAAAGNAPFLARLIDRERTWVAGVFSAPPGETVRVLLEETAALDPTQRLADVGAALRRTKRRLALTAALADIGGFWRLKTVTGVLTRFADLSVQVGLQAAHATRMKNNCAPAGLAPDIAANGLFVLGMGKHGANELNYSSDIDLVVFFEPEMLPMAVGPDIGARRATVQPYFVTLVQDLVRLLSATTGDGYVFRTDLRLRPDAGATAPAISTGAALGYYEALGQNWERAAFIKARPIAGDIASAERFLDDLAPFIWRRSLDFYAIDDVRAIKQQIHAQHGHEDIAIAGHDVKLGAGGIREIEFFAQTQQLIAGGRDRSLRCRGTIEALAALEAAGWIDARTRDELGAAYGYLRTLEHRLQMVEDQQTHAIPKYDNDVERVARFMGFADRAAFEAATTGRFRSVRDAYARLFEEQEEGTVGGRHLVFTGTDPDESTLKSLTGIGFEDPHRAWDIVRSWHHGRIPATRTQRAREVLTALIPGLLDEAAKTGDPDGALLRFDRFISGLSVGREVFSLLRANPDLLALLIDILGLAPKLGDILARHHRALDVVLDPDFFGPPLDRPEAADLLGARTDGADGLELVLDETRRVVREERLRVGVQVLRGRLPPEAAGRAHTALAEAVVDRLLDAVAAEHAARHGPLPGGGFAIVGLGSFGSAEMTAASDLDLIYIYDHRAGAESVGQRPLPRQQYAARLGQRLVNALTVKTAAGDLYEVDMRLRPSGRSGPLATQLSSFIDYHTSEAWTWEKLAMARARLIACRADPGSPFENEVAAALRQAVPSTLPADEVRGDVASMRARMRAERKPAGPFDLKLRDGGLVDIDFIWQCLMITTPRDGTDRPTNTQAAVLYLAERGALSQADAETLRQAGQVYAALQQLFAVAISAPDRLNPQHVHAAAGGLAGAPEANEAQRTLALPPPLADAIVRAAGIDRADDLAAHLDTLAAGVMDVFTRVIGELPVR